MIYVVYPLLLLLFFWGCSPKGRGNWNEEAFSLRQMKALQGFAALCIMLHHIGQKTCASWLPPNTIIPGLEFFVPIGYILVSLFIFCSGYGLHHSFKYKKDYLKKNFIVRRILPVVFSGYVVTLIFFGVRLLLGEKMKGAQIARYLLGVDLCNPNGWFVLIIPIFYLIFYLAYRFIRIEWLAFLAVVLCTLAYQLLGSIPDQNTSWIRGEWWYNSIHMFAVGIFFSKHEEKIVNHIKKYYIVYLILAVIGLFGFFMLSEFTKATVSYYWWGPGKVWHRRICLLSEMAASFAVVFFLFVLGMKIRIGNRFLDLMGKITLEFYLIHGLFVELFARKFADKLKSVHFFENNLLYVALVFVLALPSALILKKLRDLVFGRRKSGKKEAKGMEKA